MTSDNSDAGTIRYCPRALLDAVLASGWRLWADFDDTHHGAYSAGFVEWPHDREAKWPPAVERVD